MTPMMTAVVRRVNEMDGMIYEEEVPNIVDDKFTMDQRYLIPINSKEDESVTYLRLTIPEGTDYKEGYKQVRTVLQSVVDSEDIEELVRTLEIEEVLA